MKKSLYLIIALPLFIVLAACSSVNIPGTGSAQPAATQNAQGGFANFANQPVENKLAIGLLKLEGTPNAVTQKEAQDMLPLWKGLKSLSTSSTTSPDEIQALYKQIEDTLTPDQLQAIKNLSLQQADFQALMQQYGVQFQQNGGFGNGTPSPQQATRIAQFRAQGGSNGAGNGNRGNFGGGGFGGGNAGGGSGATTNGQPSVQRTPQPGRRNLGGLNYLFVDPVIKMLQQRAG
jgi:uncharacterized membrane protein YgcG